MQGTGKDASAGYHGYWITDFTQVDPHFGTNADLTKLIDKAHRKGMKVFFDVITNHTADTVDYAEKTYGYRSKGAYPYLDRDGRPLRRRRRHGEDGRRLLPVQAGERRRQDTVLAQRPDDVPQPGATRRTPASPPRTATSPGSTTCGPSGPRSSPAWRRSTRSGSATSTSTGSGSTP